MNQQRIVNIEDLEKTKKTIDEIINKSMPTSCYEQFVPTLDTSEVGEKDKEVLDYIKSNPSIIKEGVVNAFKDRHGYSRRVVFKILQRLEKLNMIRIEPNRTNSRYHHLFVNDADIRVSLITILEYFKKLYFELIDKTNPFVENNNVVGISRAELVECLIMPYKFTKDSFFDSFIFHGKLCDMETFHRKFGIIHNSMHEIFMKLYQSLMDANFISNSKEMEMFVNYSRSDVLGAENLTFIISSFGKCGLRKNAELIIDLLWMLFYPKLPLLYFEYRQLSGEGKLNDWRAIVNEEMRNLPHKRRLLYCPPSN